MPNNKKSEPEFTVTDRRRFVDDASVDTTRQDEESAPAASSVAEPGVASQATPEPPTRSAVEPAEMGDQAGQPPSSTPEQRAESGRAYQQSVSELDDQLRQELGGRAFPEDFHVGFDRVVEPLYVTTMVQLGFMGQEGQTQRRVDIIGARQSIDSLSLLQEKTKGNLTPSEANLLEEALYDLRMKYLEITNALARAVQNPPEGKPSGGKA